MRPVLNWLVAAAIIMCAGWGAFATLAPASFWLDVRSVRVIDAVVGETPIMHIDRAIYQDFLGTYIVDVEQAQKDGRFTVVCSAYNRTNYRSDAVLPDPVTLDWWSWPIKCDLQRGLYRVETRWVIEPEMFPDKLTRIMSNEFVVK